MAGSYLEKKKKGGLAVPDIKRYYTAVIIARLVEWVYTNTNKRWVKMENTLHMTQLGKNIWIPPKNRTLNRDTHELTKTVFKVWDKLYQREKWRYNSPLFPLTGTSFFYPR